MIVFLFLMLINLLCSLDRSLPYNFKQNSRILFKNLMFWVLSLELMYRVFFFKMLEGHLKQEHMAVTMFSLSSSCLKW